MSIVLLFCISVVTGNTIACNTANACKSMTIYCNPNENCDIQCKGANACDYAYFYCPTGNFNCSVLCSGSTNIATSGGCSGITIGLLMY